VDIISSWLQIVDSSTTEEKREASSDIGKHDIIVQFLAALPTPVLHQYVMDL